jgi:hypothetical protein
LALTNIADSLKAGYNYNLLFLSNITLTVSWWEFAKKESHQSMTLAGLWLMAQDGNKGRQPFELPL